MIEPPAPPSEKSRLATLRTLRLLDTPDEERFDRFTRLAQRIFDVPIALVSLVDAKRQWFKSRQGLEPAETSRSVSFCGHAILEQEPMVVEDATKDPRFVDNPLVLDDPHVRFYAGAPLRAANGMALGTLCLIDRKPRVLSDDDEAILRDLARMVEYEFTAVRLATTDELTGLSNRRGFVDLAEHALALCQRLKVPATLLFFDLDRFKQINDRFGHAAGDTALIAFARALLSSLRAADVVARIGGDEFCALLTNTSDSQLSAPLARLSKTIEDDNEARGASWELHYSVGVTTFDPARHDSLAALMDDADRRMYEEKRERARS